MTTFTLRDYVENKVVEEKDGSLTVTVEPIPFAGLVALQDADDRIDTLRHQLEVVTAECNRLRNLLNENGIKY